MSTTTAPLRLRICALDATPIEIPPGGVSLKACSFRNVDMAGILIPVFVARGCSFDSCNFTGTRFGAGYFGDGEAAGFFQTVYRDCQPPLSVVATLLIACCYQQKLHRPADKHRNPNLSM